jgi:hypothetical protein
MSSWRTGFLKFHRPLVAPRRDSFETQRAQRGRLFLENREMPIFQKSLFCLPRKVLGTDKKRILSDFSDFTMKAIEWGKFN